MTDFIQPFDFQKIFLEYFLGSAELGIIAFIIIFSLAAAKFQFSDRLFLTLLVISSLIFSFIIGQALFTIIIIVVGFVTFKSIGRILT